MAVTRDNDIDPGSIVGRKYFTFNKELTPISQAGVAFCRMQIPVGFEITAVTAWARTANAAARVDVRINAVTALAATFAPGIGAGALPTSGVLAAGNAKFGAANATVDIYLTTDAGAVMDDLSVIVHWRPRQYRRSP